ncbi:MAG: metallophosphoesterase [Spirosomataceae bacterium]
MNRRNLLSSLGAAASLLPFSGWAASPTPLPKRSVRIAHLTDVHIQPLIGAAKGFEKCLHHLQQLDPKPDLIINGGDAIMEGLGRDKDNVKKQWRLWNEVLTSENSLPIAHCLGNHDIWGPEKHKADLLYGKNWAMDELQLTRTYQSFDLGGWHIILLDSLQARPDGSWYTAFVDEAQWDWLEKDLRYTPAHVPVMVVSHVPILAACVFFDGNRFEQEHWKVPGSWMHSDANRLAQLFYQHKNVKICLSGHIHLLDKVEYNGVTYCCNGAVSGAWWFGSYKQTPPGYALIDLYEDGSFTNTYINYKHTQPS